VYDIAQIGYQQFDMMDAFDLFENPHGNDEVSNQRELYTGRKHNVCAQFAPGVNNPDHYFAYCESLTYIFIRNYKTSKIIKRVSLSQFPTCMKMIDALKIRWDEGVDTQLKDTLRPKGNFLCAIGTKEGKVMIYRFGPHSDSKLF
jgi:hypothetical protein